MANRTRKKTTTPSPPRRSLVGALRRLFKTQSEGPFFLGLQLVIDLVGNDELHRRLLDLFSSVGPEKEIPANKDAFIRSAAALLMELEPFWTHAFWDYVDDDSERAVTELKAWKADINEGMTLDEIEKGTEADFAELASSLHKYVAVSLTLLLARPYVPAEITDEELFFKRATLRTLVENLVRIEPTDLLSDGAFILPGTADDAFNELDLLDASWSYLRELSS